MHETIDTMKQMMGVTLNNTISKLGFMPEQCGDMVKSIMDRGDPIEIVSLGGTLDACREDNNYDLLKKFVKQVEERRLKQEKN